MAEEGERRKRISTNPFLYTDGSLVENDVLHGGGGGEAAAIREAECAASTPTPTDPDHTPQAEAPPAPPGRQVCSQAEAPPGRQVCSQAEAPPGRQVCSQAEAPPGRQVWSQAEAPPAPPGRQVWSQAEAPPAPPGRQVWSQARTAAKAAASSIDIDDDKLQTMTGSYSEILERPLLRQGIPEGDEQSDDDAKDEMDAVTPVYSNMDPVQAFLSQERLSAFMARDDSLGEMPDYAAEAPKDTKDRPGSLSVGRCSPDQAESALQGSGLVTRQGDIISFVADDLHTKIRLASPVSKSMVSFPGSRSSTPSLLRTALDLQVPPIDPSTINDIERHTRHIATSVDTLIENLTGTLHSISSLTVDCVETYRDAVCKTCDAVDANIKSMYQLMAKTEELSKSMKPVYKLQEQIKEVRRLLDMFENIIHSCGS